MTSEVISEPAGPRFGPYILTAVLGRGGMGVVYRAFDTVKGRTVALKVLIPELAADRAYQDRFRRESKCAAGKHAAGGPAGRGRRGPRARAGQGSGLSVRHDRRAGRGHPGRHRRPRRDERPGSRTPATYVPPWDSDPDSRARTALRTVVSPPGLGIAALSSTQAMSAARKDLLPDMPRETKVLVAAAEEGLAETLSYYVARGMDPATVRDYLARSFARHTGFRPAACQWAVDELAAVLGLDSAEARPVT